MTTLETARTPGQLEGLGSIHDTPQCPRCGADADRQHVVRIVPDGALELTVFECSACGGDHPAWS